MYKLMLMLFSIYFFLSSAFVYGQMLINDSIIFIAHRGASAYAPENTFAAFDKAVKMDADYIEVDVQMTKDSHLVIIHDLTVDRTTNGAGYVKNLTLIELQQLDAGSWFHTKYANEQIPTLSDVIEQYSRHIGIMIEIKNPSHYPGIEEKIVQVLQKYQSEQNLLQHIKVQSFNEASMVKFHSLLPSISSGIIIDKSTSPYQILQYSGIFDFISVHKYFVTDVLIKTAHSIDVSIFAWTIDRSETANRLAINEPIDGIISNKLMTKNDMTNKQLILYENFCVMPSGNLNEQLISQEEKSKG
ncbi:glycerophosphodiester phosphodiesterase family protein [Bacillus sp. SM2101]|uniref:glycerophosphodiester phosphodiesterase n=1 Tax=Bacillus sp. SM2101 TaxID=2805366 RepID=UPI001BDDEDA0|nr:glycerophosphodiester phosphodiesterase family protein [Bacillus sp. SM2101]